MAALMSATSVVVSLLPQVAPNQAACPKQMFQTQEKAAQCDAKQARHWRRLEPNAGMQKRLPPIKRPLLLAPLCPVP